MKPEKEKKLKNTVLNVLTAVALLSQIALMLALLVLSWEYARGERVFLRPLLERMSGSAGLYSQDAGGDKSSLPEAASVPFCAAVRRDGALYGAQYSEAGVSPVYDRLKPVLAEALGSASDFKKVNESVLTDALCSDMAYISFDSGVPLSMLCAWLGAEPSKRLFDADPALCIVLSSSDSGVSLICRSAKDGSAVYADTAVSRAALNDALGDMEANGAFFACDGGEIFEPFPEETLFLGTSPSPQVLGAATPDISAGSQYISAVLSAFSFNQYTVRRYETSAGESVYVQELSSVRISDSGETFYSAQSGAGLSLPVSDDADSRLTATQKARDIVSRVLSGVGGDAEAFLSGFSDDGNGRITCVFSLEAGGIPIDRADGEPFAAVTALNGEIISAVIRPRQYTSSDTASPVLPAVQAAAAAPGSGRLTLRYADNGEDTLRPDWYFSR